MGELFALSADRSTRLAFAPAAFAERTAREDAPFGGWGVAWYEGRTVQRFRQARSPEGSALAQLLADLETETSLLVAQLRRPTTGSTALHDTGPFVREQAARWHVFAHAGTLQDIARRHEIELHPEAPDTEICHRPAGETDSEHAFALLLAKLRALPRRAREPLPGFERRFRLLYDFAERMRALGPASFVYTDGSTLFVHADRRESPNGRHESPALWLLEATGPEGAPGLDERVLRLPAGAPSRLAVVASVPLGDGAWRALPEGTLLAIEAGRVRAEAAPGAPPVFELDLPA